MESYKVVDPKVELLGRFEQLMTEFFFPTTNNERKREIENILEAFGNQQDSWRDCLYFVYKSESEYVLMFAFNTIENVINRKWNTLSSADKVELRVCLWTHLTNHHYKLPSFLRDKLAKIMVDIAKREWPYNYQDFYTNVTELLRKGGINTLLGLLILRNLTEGFDSNSNLPFERRQQLEDLLLRHTPQLVSALADILDKLSKGDDPDKQTSDPPPSPERGAEALRCDLLQPILPDLLTSRTTNARYGMNDELAENCVRMCLNTLQNIFTWLPLSTHLPPTLITSVFYWASAATQTQFREKVSIAGMSAVNELLYRRLSPPGTGCALRLARASSRLLRHLTQTDGQHLHSPQVISRSPQYIDKVSEFLRLFVLLHFKRLEAEPEFDTMAYLSLMFQYTFQVPRRSSFILCIDIWLQFIDDLKPQESLKYSDVLAGLVNGVVNKIRFQQNSEEISQFDNEAIDDDGETEWQAYLRQCIECIAKVGELAPSHIFNLVMEGWQEAASAHASGSASVYQLQDLASFTQLLGRLAPTLFQNDDEAINKQFSLLVDHFLNNLLTVLHQVSSIDKHHLQSSKLNAVIQVHAGVLACIGGLLPYATRSSVQVAPLLRAASPLLLPPVLKMPVMPPVLSHAAAHLLLSVAVSLKAPDPLMHLHDLIPQAQRSLAHLEPKTAAVVRQALCVMVLECPVGNNSHSSDRAQLCGALIDAWCAPLLNCAGVPSGAACQACLPLLGELLTYFAHHNTQTKKFLATAVTRPVQAALVAFQNSNGDGQVSALVLELFLALLGSLHQQLGSSFVHQSIRMFMDVAKRQEHGALQKLLQVLKLCIEGGVLGGEAALTEVLNLCLDHVLPLVQAESADPDVTYALFDVFGSVLLDCWQHFYSSCVRLGWSPAQSATGSLSGLSGASGATPGGEGERIANAPHFRALLQAIVNSFMQGHIEVFRLNLHTLDRLNSRWKLYQKIVFRTEMLGHILAVLLGALVHRASAAILLQEEVASTCHALAAVDFNSYFNSFLPAFLASLPNLQQQQIRSLLSMSRDTDLPTFTQNLSSMVNDIRCYQMSSQSWWHTGEDQLNEENIAVQPMTAFQT